MNEERGGIIEPRGLLALPERLAALGCRKILLITGPSRRFVELALDHLQDFEVRVFDGAERHVPAAVVERAQAIYRDFQPDAVLTLGGGAATGLGKALRLEGEFHLVAIPTTYAGSEFTSIYGITLEGSKNTGREPRVKPELVVVDAELTREMPAQLTVTSLLNALSHPLSALSTKPKEELRAAALGAARAVFSVLELLVRFPSAKEARKAALPAVLEAAQVLESAELGAHHRIVHALGGRLDLPHAALHAIVLPQFLGELRQNDPDCLAEIEAELRVDELESRLFDFLRCAGAATGLRQLGVGYEDLDAFLKDQPELPQALLRNTFHGRRPSADVRQEDWGLREPVSVTGPKLEQARRVIVAVHGRGSAADEILGRANELIGDDPTICIVAPQAPGGVWYSGSYSEPREKLGAALELAQNELKQVLDRVVATVPHERVALFGFSQGACLALECFVESSGAVETLVAIAGARIGDPDALTPPNEGVSGARVLLGISEDDPWVSSGHVRACADALSAAGCEVTVLSQSGDAHRLTALQRIFARKLLTAQGGDPNDLGPAGFRGAHQQEALPGALPRRQNSPRRTAYGLYPEQLNATGFTAVRHKNSRSWVYRIRPSAQQRQFEELAHSTYSHDFAKRSPEVELTGFRPLGWPTEPTDFVDGLHTLGGAGSPSLRRGYAVSVYAANRSMDDRAFCSSDGELLLLPEQGRLTLLTEFGVLDVEPGQLALLPKGLRFSVLLRDGEARDYLAEVFAQSFELPERGPIGANALADARHFRVPKPWHEDRLCPGYRWTNKLGGKLYEASQDYSPYDVVAWHGTYAPHVYDLANFCPVSNVSFDHADPSVYTVLSAPLDEVGASTLDLVIFPPRWDPTQDTFRPPFFHRNATTELNGIVGGKGRFPFESGCCFLTPSMTPHGVVAGSVERYLAQSDEHANRPQAPTSGALWFQFETALPFCLSVAAADADYRVREWPEIWGSYRSHYKPRPR